MKNENENVNVQKGALLVFAGIGAMVGISYTIGRRIGYTKGVDTGARVASAIVKTYDKVKGTNLDFELCRVMKDNYEIYTQFLKGGA